MLPFLTEHVRQPVVGPRLRARGARAALDDAHERLAARHRRRGARDRVHERRHRGEQPRRSRAPPGPARRRGHRIVTSPVEHHAVGHTLRYLEKFGFEVVELPVDRYGRVDPDRLERGASPTARSWSRSMLANNEVGTLQPIAEIAAVVGRAPGRAAPRRRRPGGAVRRPRRRGARAPTSSRSAPTSSRARRASARCTSATGRTSSPSSRAGPRSATAGPARRTSPAPSGMAAAYELSLRGARRDRRARPRACATACRRACSRSTGVEPTGHPDGAPAGLLSIVARDTDGAPSALSLDLEGIAASVGFGLHDAARPRSATS